MNKNLFVLDFETTGLNVYLNEPIEIAIKKLNRRYIYQSLIIPTQKNIYYKYVPPKIVDLTHITDNMIDIDGVDKHIVIFNVCRFLETNSKDGEPIYIISHNGNSFDFIIFRKMIYDYNQISEHEKIEETFIDRLRYIDTILLSKLFIENESFKQSRLCQKYNIRNLSEHRAQGDIEALEKLYVILCEQYSHHKGYNFNYYLDNPGGIVKVLHCD